MALTWPHLSCGRSQFILPKQNSVKTADHRWGVSQQSDIVPLFQQAVFWMTCEVDYQKDQIVY